MLLVRLKLLTKGVGHKGCHDRMCEVEGNCGQTYPSQITQELEKESQGKVSNKVVRNSSKTVAKCTEDESKTIRQEELS